jgi:flagellar protein FliL
MPDAVTEPARIAGADEAGAPARGGSRRWLLLAMLGAPALLAAGSGAALYLVPGVAATARSLIGLVPPAAATTPDRPVFVELPEMMVTLPNDGRARQLRIHISLELAKKADGTTPAVLSPRVSDALLTYLRTLREGDLEGAIALDRLRADLFRRLDLLLGPGVLRDVLVTGLVVA